MPRRRERETGKPPSPRLLITCEHGGNRVPQRYAGLFVAAGEILNSHRGYDPGSLELAKRFANRFAAPLFSSTVTRLLVELNRSPRHPKLFSEFTRPLDREARQRLMDEFYWPHRRAVEAWIAEANAASATVLHIGVHSFTPILNDRPRRTDVGLLYDPALKLERRWATAWLDELRRRRPDLVLRRNHPYLGKSDGFTTHLRRIAPPDRYAGIELEVNQRWPTGKPSEWRQLQSDLIESLSTCWER